MLFEGNTRNVDTTTLNTRKSSGKNEKQLEFTPRLQSRRGDGQIQPSSHMQARRDDVPDAHPACDREQAIACM